MSVETWNVLQELGFVPDASVTSEDQPGLSYDFGDFKLSAGTMLSERFKPVVAIGGWLCTPRILAEIAFDLPLKLKSRELCAAILTYHLDRAAKGGVFHPARQVAWVDEGRENQHLVPEVKLPAEAKAKRAAQQAAYEAAPRCTVPRTALRYALNGLSEHLSSVGDEATVEFSFDGTVFLVRCEGKVFPLAAEGNVWAEVFTIPAGNLRRLPKRLTGDQVKIIWLEGALIIGGYRFDSASKPALTAKEGLVSRPVNPDRDWPDQVLDLAVEHIYQDRQENLTDLLNEVREEPFRQAVSLFRPIPEKVAADKLRDTLEAERMVVEPLPHAAKLCLPVWAASDPGDKREAAYMAVKQGLGLT